MRTTKHARKTAENVIHGAFLLLGLVMVGTVLVITVFLVVSGIIDDVVSDIAELVCVIVVVVASGCFVVVAEVSRLVVVAVPLSPLRHPAKTDSTSMTAIIRTVAFFIVLLLLNMRFYSDAQVYCCIQEKQIFMKFYSASAVATISAPVPAAF